MFAKGLPRLAVLVPVIAAFCLIPPDLLARGPDLCVWRHLFHLAACPACGTTRALAAFFHGDVARAWRFNHNVVITGPGLILLFGLDAVRLLRKILAPPRVAVAAALYRHRAR